MDRHQAGCQRIVEPAEPLQDARTQRPGPVPGEGFGDDQVTVAAAPCIARVDPIGAPVAPVGRRQHAAAIGLARENRDDPVRFGRVRRTPVDRTRAALRFHGKCRISRAGLSDVIAAGGPYSPALALALALAGAARRDRAFAGPAALIEPVLSNTRRIRQEDA